MTVQELITELHKYPPTMKVVAGGKNTGPYLIENVETRADTDTDEVPELEENEEVVFLT